MEEASPTTEPAPRDSVTITPSNKTLSRGVTIFGEHASNAKDKTSGKKWASCPAALWDPTARPKPDPKTGLVPKLRFGTTSRLHQAFEREYVGDVYAVAYVVVDPKGQVVPNPPRLNKADLGDMLARGYRVLFGTRWADLDEPDHIDLTDARWSMYQEILGKYDCAYYRTRGGARVVQGLTRLLGPEEYEVSIRRWLQELKQLFASVPDVKIDDSCCDWTRLMRLPRVLRDDGGKITNTWSTHVFTERLTCIDPGDCTPPVRIVAPPMPPVIADGDTRYGRAALERACTTIETSQDGKRHSLIFSTAAGIGSLVSGGELQDSTARAALEYAVRGLDEHQRVLWDGYEKGLETPRSAPKRYQFDLDALKRQLLARAVESGDLTM